MVMLLFGIVIRLSVNLSISFLFRKKLYGLLSMLKIWLITYLGAAQDFSVLFHSNVLFTHCYISLVMYDLVNAPCCILYQ